MPSTLCRLSFALCLLIMAVGSWNASLADGLGAPAGKPAAEKTNDEPARLQGPPEVPGVAWQRGPCKGRIGTVAEIDVPAGFHFTERGGTVNYLKAMGNLTGEQELACIAPDSMEWFAVFEYDGDKGYVKDDEKDTIDADALMKGMMEGNKAENEERKRRNMAYLNLVGWEVKPRYDTEANSLEWGLRLSSPDGETINYITKRLGRHGVMDVSLVVGPEHLSSSLPHFKSTLKTFNYVSGEKYSEFREGDKIAEYGLTALVAGGALAVAAKTGLLGKFLKPLLIGIAALGAGIAKFWRNIFGGRKSSEV